MKLLQKFKSEKNYAYIKEEDEKENLNGNKMNQEIQLQKTNSNSNTNDSKPNIKNKFLLTVTKDYIKLKDLKINFSDILEKNNRSSIIDKNNCIEFSYFSKDSDSDLEEITDNTSNFKNSNNNDIHQLNLSKISKIKLCLISSKSSNNISEKNYFLKNLIDLGRTLKNYTMFMKNNDRDTKSNFENENLIENPQENIVKEKNNHLENVVNENENKINKLEVKLSEEDIDKISKKLSKNINKVTNSNISKQKYNKNKKNSEKKLTDHSDDTMNNTNSSNKQKNSNKNGSTSNEGSVSKKMEKKIMKILKNFDNLVDNKNDIDNNNEKSEKEKNDDSKKSLFDQNIQEKVMKKNNFEESYRFKSNSNTNNLNEKHSKQIPLIMDSIPNISNEFIFNRSNSLKKELDLQEMPGFVTAEINKSNNLSNFNINRHLIPDVNKLGQVSKFGLKFSTPEKNIDCVLKEGYMNLILDNLHPLTNLLNPINLIPRTNPYFSSLNTLHIVPIKIVLNKDVFKVMINEIQELFIILNADIQATQIDPSNSKCFRLMLNNGLLISFCEITGISCRNIKISNDFSDIVNNIVENKKGNCSENWISAILNFKLECNGSEAFPSEYRENKNNKKNRNHKNLLNEKANEFLNENDEKLDEEVKENKTVYYEPKMKKVEPNKFKKSVNKQINDSNKTGLNKENDKSNKNNQKQEKNQLDREIQSFMSKANEIIKKLNKNEEKSTNNKKENDKNKNNQGQINNNENQIKNEDNSNNNNKEETKNNKLNKNEDDQIDKQISDLIKNEDKRIENLRKELEDIIKTENKPKPKKIIKKIKKKSNKGQIKKSLNDLDDLINEDTISLDKKKKRNQNSNEKENSQVNSKNSISSKSSSSKSLSKSSQKSQMKSVNSNSSLNSSSINSSESMENSNSMTSQNSNSLQQQQSSMDDFKKNSIDLNICFTKEYRTMLNYYKFNVVVKELRKVELTSDSFCSICCENELHQEKELTRKCCKQKCEVESLKTFSTSYECVDFLSELKRDNNYFKSENKMNDDQLNKDNPDNSLNSQSKTKINANSGFAYKEPNEEEKKKLSFLFPGKPINNNEIK